MYHIANDKRVQDKIYEESMGILPNETDQITANALNRE